MDHFVLWRLYNVDRELYLLLIQWLSTNVYRCTPPARPPPSLTHISSAPWHQRKPTFTYSHIIVDTDGHARRHCTCPDSRDLNLVDCRGWALMRQLLAGNSVSLKHSHECPDNAIMLFTNERFDYVCWCTVVSLPWPVSLITRVWTFSFSHQWARYERSRHNALILVVC